MSKRLRIVMVDDEPIQRQIMIDLFKRYDTEKNYSIEGYASLEDAHNADLPDPDVSATIHMILLDPGLATTSGEQTIMRAKSIFGERVPIVVVTGGNGEREMLEAGAHAYILKTEAFGKNGFRRLIQKMDYAITLAHGGTRWAEAKRTIHRTNDRLQVVDRYVKKPMKYSIWAIVFAAAPVIVFMIDHKVLAVLPDVASKSELDTTYAKKIDVEQIAKKSHSEVKKIAKAADQIATGQDRLAEQVLWLGDAFGILMQAELKKGLLRQRPKAQAKTHEPITVDDDE